MTDEQKPVFTTYATAQSYIHPKQQGILNKTISKMMAPKLKAPKGHMSQQTVKLKHKKKQTYYW